MMTEHQINEQLRNWDDSESVVDVIRDIAAESWEIGVRSWAHWKDGKQWVGTTGMSLKEALTRNPFRTKTV